MTIPILDNYSLRPVCKGFRSALLEQEVAYRPYEDGPFAWVDEVEVVDRVQRLNASESRYAMETSFETNQTTVPVRQNYYLRQLQPDDEATSAALA